MSAQATPFVLRIQMPHSIDDGAVRFLCPDGEQERNALDVFEAELARIVAEDNVRLRSLLLALVAAVEAEDVRRGRDDDGVSQELWQAARPAKEYLEGDER